MTNNKINIVSYEHVDNIKVSLSGYQNWIFVVETLDIQNYFALLEVSKEVDDYPYHHTKNSHLSAIHVIPCYLVMPTHIQNQCNASPRFVVVYTFTSPYTFSVAIDKSFFSVYDCLEYLQNTYGVSMLGNYLQKLSDSTKVTILSEMVKNIHSEYLIIDEFMHYKYSSPNASRGAKTVFCKTGSKSIKIFCNLDGEI